MRFTIALAMMVIGIITGLLISPLIMGTSTKTSTIYIPTEAYRTATTTVFKTMAKTSIATKTIPITVTRTIKVIESGIKTKTRLVTVPRPTTTTITKVVRVGGATITETKTFIHYITKTAIQRLTVTTTITKSMTTTVYRFVTVTPIPTTIITIINKSELLKETGFKILNWSIELDKKRRNVYLTIDYRTKKSVIIELYEADFRLVYRNGSLVNEPYPSYRVDYTMLNPELTRARLLLAQEASVNGTYFILAKYSGVEILRLKLDLRSKLILADINVKWIKNYRGNYDANITLVLGNPSDVPIAITEIEVYGDGFKRIFDVYRLTKRSDVLWLEPRSVKKITLYCPFDFEPNNYYNLKITLRIVKERHSWRESVMLTLYTSNIKTPP